MKVVYILRGIPGNGKSTLAEELCNNGKSSVICCADDYFTDIETGEYNWNVEKIGAAHKWCFELFEDNLKNDTEIIVVANTNTRETDVNKYRNLALEYNYLTFVLTVENWHNGKDIHNVPDEAKTRMKEQLKNSIKL
jgi:predicted kinase